MSAQAAGLRHVSDAQPGIRRLRSGRGFRYVGVDGQAIREPAELRRFRSLAIPPAWTEVWICPSPRGHVQATGRDAKGRKQYRYHPVWQAVRDETKYSRLIAFAEALPALRTRVAEDLARPGLPRAKVLATIVDLLETSYIRVGNDEYARTNGSYGLTTLESTHVKVEGCTVRFQFRGKSGKEHVVNIRDRRVARIIRRCQSLPGQILFQYQEEAGELRTVDSEDVNEYLREIAGADFTAKDFRTWAGTVLAAATLARAEPPHSEAEAKREVAGAIKEVAARLGTTPAVCRRAYVHPAILQAYQDGTLRSYWTTPVAAASEREEPSPDERAVWRLLSAADAAPDRVAAS
jgi:DNA topoisomerase-1